MDIALLLRRGLIIIIILSPSTTTTYIQTKSSNRATVCATPQSGKKPSINPTGPSTHFLHFPSPSASPRRAYPPVVVLLEQFAQVDQAAVEGLVARHTAQVVVGRLEAVGGRARQRAQLVVRSADRRRQQHRLAGDERVSGAGTQGIFMNPLVTSEAEGRASSSSISGNFSH